MNNRTTNKPVVPVMLVAILLCRVSSALAEDDRWRFSITPYLWLPSVNLESTVRNEPITVETNTDSFDIVSKLDFALLACGEVRKGKVGLFYDFQILKVGDDGIVGPLERRNFDLTTTLADTTLAPEFRLIEEPKFSLDVLAGVRIVYAKVSIDIDPGRLLPGLSGDQSHAWVDPIVGTKFHYKFNDSWSINCYGDIGGFGVSSRLSYQLLGTVMYSFNEHIALQVGYRYFADDFERAFKLDAKLGGPVVGLTFSF